MKWLLIVNILMSLQQLYMQVSKVMRGQGLFIQGKVFIPPSPYKLVFLARRFPLLKNTDGHDYNIMLIDLNKLEYKFHPNTGE